MLAYWERGRHLPGQHRPARPGRERRQRVRLLRRPAVRQRAAALRPPAHRLRQGPDPALPDDARQAGRAPLRLGHPRAAGRAGGDAPQRHQDHRRDPRARHREVQRGLPRVGHEVHRRVARVRHPPGALGRLRQRLPDHEPRLHGVGDLGLQAALRQGPGLRGLPRPAVLLERRDAAVQPRAADGRRRLPEPPGPGGHRRRTTSRRDGEFRAPSCSSGRRRRGPCRATSRSWSARTSTTSWSSRRTGRPSATSSAEARLPVVRPRARRRARRSTWRGKGTDLVGLHLHAAVLLLPRPRERVPRRRRAEFVTTTDGTGLVHTAGAFGEDDKEVTDREGIEAGDAGRQGRRGSPSRSSSTRACRSSTPTCTIIDHLKAATSGEPSRLGHRRAPCCCAARPTTTPTRTAGAAASP